MFGFGKFDGKHEEKNIEMKSNRKKKAKKIKFNKLFLYISSNSFYFFLFIVTKFKN